MIRTFGRNPEKNKRMFLSSANERTEDSAGLPCISAVVFESILNLTRSLEMFIGLVAEENLGRIAATVTNDTTQRNVR